MGFVSTPLPVGRDVFPFDRFPAQKQLELIEQATAARRPARWLRFEHCQMPSRAWYEWHWYRGIDPDRKRHRGLSPGLRQFIIDRDGLVCGLCGLEVERDDVHIDHIIPVVRGGSDDAGNLQVSHSACNMRKGAGA